MSRRLLEIISQYYDRMAPASRNVLENSVDLAQNYGHPVVASLHLTVSILRDSSSGLLLSNYGINANQLAERIESRFYIFANGPQIITKPATSYLGILSRSVELAPEKLAITPPHLLAGTLLERRLKGLAINPSELQDQADRVSAFQLDSSNRTKLVMSAEGDAIPNYAEIDPQMLIFLAAGVSVPRIAELLKLIPQICDTRSKRLSLMGLIPRIETPVDLSLDPKVALQQRAVDLRATGLTNRQIATEMELKATQVDQLLREAMAQNGKIRKRRIRRTSDEVRQLHKQLIALRNDPRNLEMKEIAEILGVPVTNLTIHIRTLIKQGKIPKKTKWLNFNFGSGLQEA